MSSVYLTPESSKWLALEKIHERVFFEPAEPRSSTQLAFFKPPSGNDLRGTKRKIGKIVDSLYKQESLITEEDWLILWSDISRGFNSSQPSIYENWFSPYLSDSNRFSTTSIETVLQNSNDDVYVMLFMDLIKYWGFSEKNVDGVNRQVVERIGPVTLTDKTRDKVTEKILELSDSGDLGDLATKLIGEILKDYTFLEFKRAIANRIGEKLRNVNQSVDLSTILVKKQYDAYIDFHTETEDGVQFFYLTENIYSGERTKIAVGSLSPEERASFEWPTVFQYPDAIIKKSDGTIDEELKADLENFNEIDGTDITEYPFEFVKDSYPVTATYEFAQLDSFQKQSDNIFISLLKDVFVNSETPEEKIKTSVQSSYLSFLKQVAKDFQENKQLTETIGAQWQIAQADQSDAISFSLPLIYLDKIVAAKKTLFDQLANVQKEADTDGDGAADEKVDPDAREAAYEKQLVALKEGKAPDLEETPSEEDIENRQKYFKQCALMLNMPTLRDTYQQKLVEQYKKNKPYDGRFITLRTKDGEQETMLSSLVSSGQEQTLFELESHKMTRLLPKIRLFKVFNDPKHGEKEIEFIFNRTSDIRTTFMDDNAFDKGTGVGLKNFSFEFNGTNPAEARNDIKANLTLFFQSFQDFTKDRVGYKPEDKYRYVDLVIQPTPDKKGEVGGIKIQSDRQYEPQFYRIRAEVGYVVPTEEEGFTEDEIKAIRVSNKSFFLNMVDHNLSFGKDGTVEIKITYRAYLESLLKHPRLDALASPELINKRIENARTLAEQVSKRECSVEQIKELQVSLAAQESVLVKQSLSSIIKRLRSRGVIYTTLIKKADKDFFLKKGFFNKCEFETSSVEDGSDGADVKLVLNSDLPESSDDFDFIDSNNRSIQFFYFGDLLYTILDCVYKDGGKIREGTGFDRNSIILGSFEFEPFQTRASGTNVYNIADIPISVDFFSRWFVDNVVSQKSTRKTFPVMNFIRNLSNYLIKPSLVENCVNRKLETRLRFQTAQVSAYKEGGKNPLLESYSLGESLDDNRPQIALDVEPLRTSGDLPFDGGPENDANSSFKDFHTFIVLSALGSTLSYSGVGNYSDDKEKGRFHVHVGQNAGLVKTLSLSKSDQQYIREARFFQNGIDGLLQLSAVYVANIEMFGNTLFYPGMEIFFNPYGIGGDGFDPRVQGSIANKLGIGGYHTITSVKSTITPGKFSTSITAQQYYSGDKSGNPNIVKKKNAEGKVDPIEQYSPENPENEGGFENCKQVILDAQNYAFEEGTLAGRSEPSSTASVEAPAEEPEDEFVGPPVPVTTEEVESPAAEVEVPTEEESTPPPKEEPKPTPEVVETTEEEPESNVVVVTQESLDEEEKIIKSYGGKLKTVTSSSSSSGRFGTTTSERATLTGGVFYETNKGNVFFLPFIDGSLSKGEMIVVEDHSRIVK